MRKRVLLAIAGTVASVIMGASAVNGSFDAHSSYHGCNVGEYRLLSDPFFDVRANAAECTGLSRTAGAARRTSPRASIW